jgi:type II secretory pathway component PulJ
MKQIIATKKYSKDGKLQKGFTIVEIVVAMTIFILILGVSTNIFISAVAQQRRILSEQQLVNQMSYVIEYMAKALRMAIKDEEGVCVYEPNIYEPEGDEKGIFVLTRQNIGAGGFRGIRFLNASNTNALNEPICQEFFLDDNVLKEIKSVDGSVDKNTDNAVPITSEKIEITSIKFAINGDSATNYASSYDNTQPSITIFLEAKIVGDNRPAKKIQTTISQRNLNIE